MLLHKVLPNGLHVGFLTDILVERLYIVCVQQRRVCDGSAGSPATPQREQPRVRLPRAAHEYHDIPLKARRTAERIETAKLFQMSRTPVHEAITTLHNDWLIEIFPQRGTQVSRIDPALVKEGYSTRLLLESALLKDVAGKIGRSQVQELWDCMCHQESLRPRMPDAVDEFIHLDDEFHRLMYYFGGRSHTWLAIRGLVSTTTGCAISMRWMAIAITTV
ncbi:MAG: GntR family transcriptional regulator [Subdoligranulum sp.]|nr:GntR family transcriptional regulator [Subdoligranulum sp.]